MTEQSCGKCKWFKKFREEFEYGICSVEFPFWIYREVDEQILRRPDLNENEGTKCAAWEEKPNGE